MTQRIFDVENEKDIADLWDILPDEVCKIEAGCGDVVLVYDNAFRFNIDDIFSINFHSKTEITRPIQEVTEADIGKLCVFWQDYYTDGAYYVGVLEEIDDRNDHRIFRDQKYDKYSHCRRLTKQEIEELC